MTAHELARKLLTLPDAPVIYRCCSDWDELDADDVGVITADESKAAVEAHLIKQREWATGERANPSTYNSPGQGNPLKMMYSEKDLKAYEEGRAGGSISGAVHYRGGRYCNAYPLGTYPADEQPVYVTVVTLPGN